MMHVTEVPPALRGFSDACRGNLDLDPHLRDYRGCGYTA
jgi:hypothetical protein